MFKQDSDWIADQKCYGGKRLFLREQSIWAIWVYRFGRRVDGSKDGIKKKIFTILYWLLFRLSETVVGISLPKSALIGPGLRIWHFGGIFIHPNVIIGSNCTLRQGVTIGNRYAGGGVPTIGNDVELGAYAQVLGGVKIGNGCKVGAMSVVLKDIPDGATAVGIPAKIIFPEK